MTIQTTFRALSREQNQGANARMLIVVSNTQLATYPDPDALLTREDAQTLANTIAKQGNLAIVLERHWLPGTGNRWRFMCGAPDITPDYALWLGKAVRQIIFGQAQPQSTIQPPFVLHYRTVNSHGAVITTQSVYTPAL